MEKTYEQYLEEILCSPVSDQLTGSQRKAIDAMAELLGFCDYERLCELVDADRDGRCVVLPAGGCSNEDGKRALKNAMFVVGLTNNGANRYAADAIAEKLTRESAESALNEQEVNE